MTRGRPLTKQQSIHVIELLFENPSLELQEISKQTGVSYGKVWQLRAAIESEIFQDVRKFRELVADALGFLGAEIGPDDEFWEILKKLKD